MHAHTIAENKEPIGAASPIGKMLSGNHFEARYAPGIRKIKIEHKLWINDMIDFSCAQK